MERVKERVQKMISIVRELEADFPGRLFTLDGHLVGSIGEAMAAYYYGIELYGASAKVHDGEIGVIYTNHIGLCVKLSTG